MPRTNPVSLTLEEFTERFLSGGCFSLAECAFIQEGLGRSTSRQRVQQIEAEAVGKMAEGLAELGVTAENFRDYLAPRPDDGPRKYMDADVDHNKNLGRTKEAA